MAAATDPSLSRLEQQIEFVSHATDGVAGVAAMHIESGRSVSLRAAETFPMASAFKLPVAVQLMGLPFSENLLIAMGKQYQSRTDWHRRRPPV